LSSLSEVEEERCSVMNTATGEVLSGEKAPLASELEQWLIEHPGSEPSTNTLNRPLC
jgi:hypothetical protein